MSSCGPHMFPAILALVLIVCVWIFGDVSLGTKLMLTVLYLASWALVLLSPWIMIAAHALLSIVFGAAAFGVDWLNQRAM